MTDWDRVARLFGPAVLAHLQTRSVGIVGLGSGGGFVAVSLAMSGVGRFVLIDDDVLKPHNVVRHAADLRDVGRPKVEAVADLIRQRSPAAQVTAVCGRVEQHGDLLAEVDIVIAGVDSEHVKFTINELCLKQRRPAVYAGVYERGEGGDVCLLRPGDGPCYACWAEHLREGLAQSEPNTELDYGMIGPDGTLAAEPGLWLHVVRVAAAQADMALNYLLEGTSAHRALPANTVVLANTFLEIYEGEPALPYTAEWIAVPRNPACLVCGTGDIAAEAETPLSLEDLMRQGGVTVDEQDEG